MGRGKITAMITVIIIVAATAIIFWPAKIESRHNFKIDENVKILGDTSYYLDEIDNDFDFELTELEDITKITEYICGIKNNRSIKGVETPLNYGNHRYTFRLFNKKTGESQYMYFNGRYLEVAKGRKSVKYRIYPKDINLAIFDRMIEPYIVEGQKLPLTPIAFTDESESIQDMSTLKDGWVDVMWIDGHAKTEYYAVFNNLKPYNNIEIYEDGKRVIIFYDEGEGEKTDTSLKLDHLPAHPGNEDSMVIFILNGERSYNAQLTYGEE